MSITVEMSAPYLGLGHLVSAMAEAVVRANRSGEELQNPEEMLAAAALTWESNLRELAERRAIKGHDWDSLAAEDWVHLNIERDVFFVDDLNDCDDLTRVGFRFVVVESESERLDEISDIEEIIYNPVPVDWEYWVFKMPTLSASEAARLMAGLDPDVYKSLDEDPVKNDTKSARKRASNMERLALRESRERAGPFEWLLWAKEQGFEVHRPFSRFANEKHEYETAVSALRAFPPREAAYWQDAEDREHGRREITFSFAGSYSTRHFTLPQFVTEVSERLTRWKGGEYALIEAAQVLADANSGLEAESLCEQMDGAIHSGELVLRRNDLPIPKADIPRGRLWNRFVLAGDVNDWLTASRARYRLSYPYEAPAPKPQERRVSDEDWKQFARTRAVEIIRRQRARDLFPSQQDIADEIAAKFRQEGILGTDGKPLSGATIKRHALKGISSAQAKQLSTGVSRGK